MFNFIIMGKFLNFSGGPTDEELSQIENEGDYFIDLTAYGIEELVKETNDHIVPIDNRGKTFCESATELDGYVSSEKSLLENAYKSGNTASPFSFLSRK